MEHVTEKIIKDLTYPSSGLPNPLHSSVARRKLTELTASMVAEGWVGGPTVVHDNEWVLTGSHRIQAAADAWNEHGIEVLIPRVDVEAVCDRYGIDWLALVADKAQISETEAAYEAARELDRLLPAEAVESAPSPMRVIRG